jgi:hypothetical protein
MRTEAAPKKSPASVAAGGDKGACATHSEEFGGVHGSARPLLRDDAAGEQQHRDDEQGAAHAAAFKECCFSVALIPATSRSTTTMLGAFMYPRAMREMVL